MKQLLSLLLAFFLMIPLTACNNGSPQTNDGSSGNKRPGNAVAATNAVGLSVPNDTDRHWQEETAALSALLEQAGCTVVTEYAQDDPALQASQIQAMIDRPVTCLVIAAIDPLALTGVLQQADQAGIPVIAYDRLLTQTDAVSAYVGFDYQAIGAAIGNSIVRTKQLETASAESRSHTIEFFMGSPEDNNALALYAGVLQVLQPFLDSGALVCRTGRTAFEDTCTQDWSGELAKANCQSYLTECYTDAPPEILCAASDEIAGGCVSALETSGSVPGEGWPLITGQGAELAAVKRILTGSQSITVFADRSALSASCATAVKNALGLAPADAGGSISHNGTQQIPAFFATFTPVDAQNYQAVLIDSGILSKEQLTSDN